MAQDLINPPDFKCIEKIVSDIIIDINAEVREYGDDFDYRGKLRDSKWVKDLKDNVVNNFLKLVERKRITSFKEEWGNYETITKQFS